MEQITIKKKGGKRKGAGAKKLGYETKIMRIPVDIIPAVKELRKAYKQQVKALRVNP